MNHDLLRNGEGGLALPVSPASLHPSSPGRLFCLWKNGIPEMAVVGDLVMGCNGQGFLVIIVFLVGGCFHRVGLDWRK